MSLIRFTKIIEKMLSFQLLKLLLVWFVVLASPAISADEAKPAATDESVDKSEAAVPAADWPVFRGNALATGVARSTLPQQPELLWTRRVEDGAFEATAVIADGTVYVGDVMGKFLAVRLSDGEPLWEFHSEAGFAAPGGVHDNRVYVGDLDGRFYCFDRQTGDRIWSFEADAEIDGGASFHGQHVLIGSQDATLYCLDAATGDLVWKHEIDDQIRCWPTIVDQRVFLAGCDGKLHIIDVNNGQPIDSVPIDAPTGSTPAVRGDCVYFGTEGAEFLCVNWKEPKVVWRFPAARSGDSFRSSAAVIDDLVIFGGRDRRLHALRADDKKEVWSFATRGYVDSSPVVVGDRVFVGSADGRLYAVDRTSGKLAWQYEAGGRFTASPAVADGRLVIGNENGTLYCFGKKAE